jgi:hypothetical protein
MLPISKGALICNSVLSVFAVCMGCRVKREKEKVRPQITFYL